MKRRGKGGPSENTFYWLCQEFMKSPKFTNLARNSQLTWGRELKFACQDDILGSAPLTELRPALIQGYLDGWSDKPGKQAAALTALRALSKWAGVRDLLTRDIAYGIETEGQISGHIPWTDEQVRLAEMHARSDIARAVSLGANTGQRVSDLVRMGWGDIETIQGRPGINVTQVKTGRQVWCPITAELERVMATWEKKPGPFLRRLDGNTVWDTPKKLSDHWTYQRDKNPLLSSLRDLVLHGLRGHACVRLYRDGHTTREVSVLVGMSLDMVENYCRLSAQKDDAIAAVLRIEGARTKRDLGRKSGTDEN